MDLSICIVSWNTQELLRQCLRSTCIATRGVDYEVLVVDNASGDGSQDMVRREFPAARLFVNEVNTGFAVGSNLAVENSIGRNILLLNSDTLVMPGTLEAMTRFLDEHPETGVIGCRLIFPDGTPQVSYRKFPSLTREYLRSILLAKAYHRIAPLRSVLEPLVHGQGPNDRRSVDWVSGACLMTRKEVFDQIGMLDERFFMFCEEIDWCYRARQAGWDIQYIPDVSVIHYGGESSKHHRLRTYFALVTSSFHYFRKMRGA